LCSHCHVRLRAGQRRIFLGPLREFVRGQDQSSGDACTAAYSGGAKSVYKKKKGQRVVLATPPPRPALPGSPTRQPLSPSGSPGHHAASASSAPPISLLRSSWSGFSAALVGFSWEWREPKASIVRACRSGGQ